MAWAALIRARWSSLCFLRQQPLDRHVDLARVADIGVAIGEGEPPRLDFQVQALDAGGIELQVEALQDIQQHQHGNAVPFGGHCHTV